MDAKYTRAGVMLAVMLAEQSGRASGLYAVHGRKVDRGDARALADLSGAYADGSITALGLVAAAEGHAEDADRVRDALIRWRKLTADEPAPSPIPTGAAWDLSAVRVRARELVDAMDAFDREHESEQPVDHWPVIDELAAFVRSLAEQPSHAARHYAEQARDAAALGHARAVADHVDPGCDQCGAVLPADVAERLESERVRRAAAAVTRARQERECAAGDDDEPEPEQCMQCGRDTDAEHPLCAECDREYDAERERIARERGGAS